MTVAAFSNLGSPPPKPVERFIPEEKENADISTPKSELAEETETPLAARAPNGSAQGTPEFTSPMVDSPTIVSPPLPDVGKDDRALPLSYGSPQQRSYSLLSFYHVSSPLIEFDYTLKPTESPSELSHFSPQPPSASNRVEFAIPMRPTKSNAREPSPRT